MDPLLLLRVDLVVVAEIAATRVQRLVGAERLVMRAALLVGGFARAHEDR